jgi:hypothetical protein
MRVTSTKTPQPSNAYEKYKANAKYGIYILSSATYFCRQMKRKKVNLGLVGDSLVVYED